MAGDPARAVDRQQRYPGTRDVGVVPQADGDRSSGAGGQVRATGDVTPVDLCRITVLTRNVQVDLALPADVPISVLMPGVVDMISVRGSTHAPAADPSGRPWTLSRIGHSPFAGTSTLNEVSVRDGELLVLGVADIPAPPPLFDDLMYAVATTGSTPNRLWSRRTAQVVGFAVAAAAVVLACVSLLLPGFEQIGRHAASLDTGIGAAAAAALAVVAGSVIGRVYGDDRTGVFLSACGVPLAFTSGLLFVPGPVGAPHVLLGSAASGATAVLASRLGGHGFALFTGTAVASAIAVTASTVASFSDVQINTVGAGTAIAGLAGLAVAPRMSMLQAHLPLPPVPTAGAPLDDDSDDEQPTAEQLAALSGRARSYLTGLVCASCAAASAGALLAALPTADSGGIYSPGIILALLVALVLLLRGRTFAAVEHAVPLVLAGSTVILVLLGALVSTTATTPLITFAAALLTSTGALTFGSLIPRGVYSPVLRRAAELVDYAAVAAVIPIACWVGGLYSMMRGL